MPQAHTVCLLRLPCPQHTCLLLQLSCYIPSPCITHAYTHTPNWAVKLRKKEKTWSQWHTCTPFSVRWTERFGFFFPHYSISITQMCSCNLFSSLKNVWFLLCIHLLHTLCVNIFLDKHLTFMKEKWDQRLEIAHPLYQKEACSFQNSCSENKSMCCLSL